MRLNRHYKMTATYWEKTGNDGYGGGIFAAPVNITVHWEDKNELFYSDMGDEKISKSIVFAKIDLTVGGFLYLGISTELNPYELNEAYEIKAFSKIPSIRADQFERKALL